MFVGLAGVLAAAGVSRAAAADLVTTTRAPDPGGPVVAPPDGGAGSGVVAPPLSESDGGRVDMAGAAVDAGDAPGVAGTATPPVGPGRPAPLPPVEPASVPPGGIAGLPPLQVHAFVSQGFIKSTQNNFLTESKRGSFEFTEVGINFTQVLTGRLRTGIQLFARELGKVGDYRARVDWFYLDYRLANWLGVRAGRTKVPFGLYNEVNDVDAARVPVLLPLSVYPPLNRDLLLAQTGLELYGYVPVGAAGALDYRLYGGTLYVDPPQAPAGSTLVDFQVPYVVGARVLWETPLDGLRLGASAQALRLNSYYSVSTGPGTSVPVDFRIPFRLWLASMEYTGHDLILAAEYGRWYANVESTGQPTVRVENERYYVLAAYRVRPWFTPGAYYSSLIPDVDKRSGRENYQYDWAATLRFDINPFWLIKLEGHFVRGTAELSPELNGGQARSMLARDWVLFLAKTTVYF